MNAKIIALCNQKGGVGKTITTIRLRTGLTRQGKRANFINLDAQSNLTEAHYRDNESFIQSIFCGGHTGMLFENTGELRTGRKAADQSDFRDAGITISQHILRVFNTFAYDIVFWRISGFIFKQMSKMMITVT